MTKKSKRIYIDQAGNRLSGNKQVERHRMIFDKKFYHGPAFRSHEYKELYEAYRIFPGFVDVMRLDLHQEIHKNIEPPIKPHEDLMRLILSDVNTKHLANSVILENTIIYLDNLANLELEREVTQRQVDEASLLLDNLMRQKEFVDLGRVALLQASVF